MERDLWLRSDSDNYTEISDCTLWTLISDISGSVHVEEMTGHVIIIRNAAGPAGDKVAKFVPDIFVNNYQSEIRTEIDSDPSDPWNTREPIPYRYYLGFGHFVNPLPEVVQYGCVWAVATRKDMDEYRMARKVCLENFIRHEEDFMLDGYRPQHEIEANIGALGYALAAVV